MKSVQIAVRLPEGLLQRIEWFRTCIQDRTPGLVLSRADAVRMLVTTALRTAELQASPWEAEEPDLGQVN